MGRVVGDGAGGRRLTLAAPGTSAWISNAVSDSLMSTFIMAGVAAAIRSRLPRGMRDPALDAPKKGSSKNHASGSATRAACARGTRACGWSGPGDAARAATPATSQTPSPLTTAVVAGLPAPGAAMLCVLRVRCDVR